MKIVKLTSENVKRLVAVEVTPDGSVVKIGGKNGAGKSSVLDSIAYAFGGQALVPAEPIRRGEDRASIEVDLGDLVVIRRFTKKDGKTTSTLVLKNKEGATYPSPQAVLDKLLGKLTFDPMAFNRAEPKQQREVLAKLVNVDTSLVEAKKKSAFDRRTALNRDKKAAEAQLAAAPHHKDAPAEEISIAELTAGLQAAEDLVKKATKEREVLLGLEANAQALADACKKQDEVVAEIAELLVQYEQKLKDAGVKKSEIEEKAKLAGDRMAAQQAVVKAAEAAVPDTSSLRAGVNTAEEVNRKVRANQKRAELEARVADLTAKAELETKTVETLETQRLEILSSASYPIDGLGLSDDGVTFNGLPFDQAGDAEKLQVSVAIGLALNPTIKVLLVRNGNDLDEDSMAKLAQMAEEAQAQVWVEWVTSSAEGVSVLIADGEVV